MRSGHRAQHPSKVKAGLGRSRSTTNSAREGDRACSRSPHELDRLAAIRTSESGGLRWEGAGHSRAGGGGFFPKGLPRHRRKPRGEALATVQAEERHGHKPPRHPGHPRPTAAPPPQRPYQRHPSTRSSRTAANGAPPPPKVANVASSPALAAPAAAVAAVDALLSPQVAPAAVAATRAAAPVSRARRPFSFTGQSSTTLSAAAVVAPPPLHSSTCCDQRHHRLRFPHRGGHRPGRGGPLRRKR